MKRHFRIRNQLFFLVLSISIPLIFLVAYNIQRHSKYAESYQEERLVGLSRLIADNTQVFIEKMERMLAEIAQQPLNRALDPGRCDPLLKDFLNLHREITNIGVVDRNGQIICSGLPRPVGESYFDREWFQEVIRTNDFVVGKLVMGRFAGIWLWPLAYPIRDNSGKMTGAVYMGIDSVRFDFSLKGLTLPRGAEVMILDNEGVVVARSLNPEGWVGKDVRGMEVVDLILRQTEGRGKARGIDGVERVYGFTTIPVANWRVYLGIPAEAVFSPTRDEAIRSILMVAVVVLAIGVVAYFISWHIERPIRALVKTAGVVAQGHVEERAFLGGPAEIIEVAREFNVMLDARRAAEGARRKTEEHFREVIEDIFRFVPEALLVFTDKGNLFKHNKAFRDIVQEYSGKLNYTEEELAETILKEVKNRIANGDRTEIRIPKKQG